MAKNIEEIRAALAEYGITGAKEIYYNPSYEQLFKDEMDPALTGYDKGVLTELDSVNVMTGIYTGRSPKDKYIVMDAKSKDTAFRVPRNQVSLETNFVRFYRISWPS